MLSKKSFFTAIATVACLAMGSQALANKGKSRARTPEAAREAHVQKMAGELKGKENLREIVRYFEGQLAEVASNNAVARDTAVIAARLTKEKAIEFIAEVKQGLETTKNDRAITQQKEAMLQEAASTQRASRQQFENANNRPNSAKVAEFEMGNFAKNLSQMTGKEEIAFMEGRLQAISARVKRGESLESAIKKELIEQYLDVYNKCKG